MNNQVDWTTLAVVFISAVLPVLLAWVGAAWRRKQKALEEFYVAHTNETERGTIEGVVKAAVLAAQQAGLANLIVNAGQVKKTYALDFAQTYLRAHGIVLDTHVLDKLVETRVYEQFHSANTTTTVTATTNDAASLTATATPEV